MPLSKRFSQIGNSTFTASGVIPVARKKPRKIVTLLCTAAVAAILAACAANPEKPVVVSKKDGSFDRSVIQPETESPAVGSTQAAVYTDAFTSTDKTVTFTYHINEQFPAANDPVVEIVPHYLTAEDAKRAAAALLGDVDWFEREPILEPEYTKEQIQEKINRWSQYTSSEAVSQLLAREPAYADSVAEIVKGFIEEYTGLYESAPSGSPKACEWTLKKDSYYLFPPEEIVGLDLSEDNDAIEAVAKVGEVEYTFCVSTRNGSDYKVNNINLYLGGGDSPSDIDTYIYQAKLCRKEKPTEEDIAAAVAKAEKMLADMDLGQWQVDSTSVQTNNVGNYIIHVNAVPVIHGVSAVRVPQFGNLKSTAAYASNYYMTDASFRFSGNGDLLSFKMYSPIDTKEIVNENAAVKSLDELMELAKNHLTLSDYLAYGLSGGFIESYEKQYGEKCVCQVDLCQMEYGLLRVKVPNTDESYYYVPGMVLYGTVDYLGSETGTVYASSGESFYNSRIVPIVAINAVDGSNIELSIS